MTEQEKYDELLEDITAEVVDLYSDYDRMSTCGKEALDRIAYLLKDYRQCHLC
jgi:hypothetical protein